MVITLKTIARGSDLRASIFISDQQINEAELSQADPIQDHAERYVEFSNLKSYYVG